jgi:ABC-type multidrug transport system permease subunit
VTAVLTIPEGFIGDLQSGIRPPVLELTASRRSPIEADAIERRLEAAVFRLNQSLAIGYVDQILRLVDLVAEGGELGLFGRSGDALGLRRSRVLVRDLQRELRAAGQGEAARRLEPIVNFIDETQSNLDLAKPAANAIRAPIEIEVNEGAEGREPLSAFGFAGALLVSLGLAGVLLAAAAMSSEREDHVLARLRRGLISSPSLVAEKMAFTASACLIVGLLLLGGVAIFTSLAVGRWGLWLIALILAGLAFGALGVLAGALARETRTALLVALMLALPLLALGLLPDAPVAEAISQVVPFGPAFDAFQTLLVEPVIPGGDLSLNLGHLALLALVFGGLAAWAVRRRAA